jgi:ABC-type branched-subunit amino acid transport system substrate-binding protein
MKIQVPSVHVRRTGVAAGVLLTLLSAAACGGGSSSSSSKTVTIAAVEDVTGPNSFNGGGAVAGALTAEKEINAAGGINGAQVKIKVYDTTSVVATSQGVIRQVIASKPAAVVGALMSVESTGSAAVIASGQVPWVTASYPIAALKDAKHWFSTSPTGSGVASGAVAGLTSLLGGSLNGKKIAFEGLAIPAVDNNLAAIDAAVTAAGGSMGKVTRDPLGFTSWTSQAAAMAATKPDAVIINANEPGTSVVAKALKVAGFTGQILSTEGANSNSLLSGVSQSNFYVVRETFTPSATDALYQAAVSAGQPTAAIGNPYFAKEYANVHVIAAVLAKCGNGCSADKFASTLKALGDVTVPNQALLGPLNYSSGLSGLTAAQVFAWDASKSAAVAHGSTFSITN